MVADLKMPLERSTANTIVTEVCMQMNGCTLRAPCFVIGKHQKSSVFFFTKFAAET